jgi:hypothetical protein
VALAILTLLAAGAVMLREARRLSRLGHPAGRRTETEAT